jgi:hypothetical protein
LHLFTKYGILNISDEEFNQLEELDWIDVLNTSKEQDYYQSTIMPIVKKGIQEFIEENKEFANERRINYLETSIKTIEKELFDYENDMIDFKKKGYSILTRVFLQAIIWGNTYIKQRKLMLERFRKELKWLKSDITTNKITKEQIERAEKYPFNQLVQLNRRGFMKCFAHNEKTPSMSWNKKNNTLHCFGCGRTWNTISYIMETQNKTFKESVLLLNN